MIYLKNLYSKRPKKLVDQDCAKIIEMVKKENLRVIVVEYGSYNTDDFRKSLQNVDLVVVFQDGCIETQGLAIVEIWSENKPTFINYQINEFGGTTAPYLCTQNGLYYKNFNELQEFINLFYNDVKFRSSFAPSDFIRANMSDKVSVRNLIRICSRAK